MNSAADPYNAGRRPLQCGGNGRGQWRRHQGAGSIAGRNVKQKNIIIIIVVVIIIIIIIIAEGCPRPNPFGS